MITRIKRRLDNRLSTLLDESEFAALILPYTGGVMFDVGAHYGYSLARFAERGWEIHAFEPDPRNRAVLERQFGGKSNVQIIPVAASDASGELPLYISDESSGISSLAPFTDSHVYASTAKVIRLADYVREHNVTRIDFLKIDVEGFEQNVLQGLEWAIKPKVIVLEFEDSKSYPLGYSWRDLAEDLVDGGYDVVVSEWYPIVRYGSTHRWRRFARYPTTLADPAAWGNLIATSGLDTRLTEKSLAKMRRMELARYHAQQLRDRLKVL